MDTFCRSSAKGVPGEALHHTESSNLSPLFSSLRVLPLGVGSLNQ